MKVLLDLRHVRGSLHGIARYALELARRLPALEPSWRFEGLVPRDGLPADLGDLTPHLPLRRATSEFLSPLEQVTLPADLVRARADLVHATSFSVPAAWPGRLVATLHDANHLALAESGSYSRTAYYRLVVAPRSQRAQALITVSEFSRSELARHLDLAPERFQVIHNGVDSSFRPLPEADVAEFRARRGLPRRYFAAVGNQKAFKNLKVLLPIAAGLPVPLVLLAGRGARRALGFGDDIIELSPLSDDELVRFYNAASAVLIPSRYEGFGLPALEAMACGVPVIASSAGAHEEIIGNTGLLVAPDNPLAWREACQRVLRDEVLRKRLQRDGPERAARFSWDDCARQTLAVYRRALGLA